MTGGPPGQAGLQEIVTRLRVLRAAGPSGTSGRGGVCRPRHRKCPRRRFGHDHDRAGRSARAGPRHRSGREPAQPSAVPASEHQQVAVADEFGQLRGGPSADHLLPGWHVVGHLANGLVDGGPDQCVTVYQLVRERIPGRPGGILVGVGSGYGRWTKDIDQKQPHPAPTGLPDRPRQRPPARSGAADAHDQARGPAGWVVHGAFSFPQALRAVPHVRAALSRVRS